MSGTDFYYEQQVRLAEEIAAIVPIEGGVKSFFGNSGTEAIEAAITPRTSAARAPRSASSSWTVGTPNTAITASPMNFSTVAPCRSSTVREVSK